MADEYIRLDTTIMGIDGLINEAPTGSQARALICAKDMIYDQQRYVSEMKPVKHGRWENEYLDDDDVWWADCTNCKNDSHSRYGRVSIYAYCPNCGARMDGEQNEML